MICQVNVYVIDTIRRYYVMFVCGGQYLTEGQMVLWKGFFKTLLRKSVWMQKALNAKKWYLNVLGKYEIIYSETTFVALLGENMISKKLIVCSVTVTVQ